MNQDPFSLDFAAVPEHKRPAVQFAPLIDCVFLLICFYLFVGQLISEQKDAQVKLPVMLSPTARAEAPAEITINLRSDGSLRANNRHVDLQELGEYLRSQAARARGEDQPLRVVVRADRELDYGRLDEVLGACKLAGLAEVVFRAERGRGP